MQRNCLRYTEKLTNSIYKSKILHHSIKQNNYLTTSSSFSSSSIKKNKPRIVILGSGWGGNTLARRLDKTKYDVRLISPANHFLFTPLLPSTTVGTLEFRAIQEPVRTIPNLGEYYQAKARALDTSKQIIECEDLFKKHKFQIKYDYLCLATGSKTNTFQTPGVAEHEGTEVFFLKHLHHARQIRNRILECFERASNPNLTQLERERLLSLIVVGGGPTSCEFVSELYDFIQVDIAKWYPDLMKHGKITLLEAGPGLLGSFHEALANYYLQKLREKNIDVRVKTAVVGVEDRYFNLHKDLEQSEQDQKDKTKNGHYTVAKLADGTELPFSTMVWSAGLSPVKFIENIGSENNISLNRGRVEVDEYLRVPDYKGRIFALGDCAHFTKGPLPPTASVAEQQAYYLGDCFNMYYSKFHDKNNNQEELPLPGNVAPALMP